MPIPSVYQPNAPKRDPLDTIAKLLQIAQSGYGIKTDYEQSKLLKLKEEQTLSEIEKEKAAKNNIYDEGSAKNFYFVSDPTAEGAQPVYIRTNERKLDNTIALDKEGKPKTYLEKKYHIPKDTALTQAYLQKNQQGLLTLEEAQMEANNGIPTRKLLDYDISYEQKPGYLQKWTYNAEGQGVDIWAKKREKAGQGKTPSSLPEWAKSPEMASGYASAKESGIANPTPDQAFANAPKNVQESVRMFTNSLDKSTSKDFDLYEALKNFDTKIGIDVGRNPDGSAAGLDAPIPGVGGTVNDLKGWAGPVGRWLSPEQQNINRAAVQGVLNLLLSKRSGAAITPNEAQRLSEELSLAYGSNNPRAVRETMASIRNTLRRGLQNLETSLPAKSIKIIRESAPLHSESPLFKTGVGTPLNRAKEQAADKFLQEK